MTLIISEERDGAATVLAVRGRVDGTTAEAFGDRLNAALDRRAGPVVIDCGGLTYLNSAGIGVLLLAVRRGRAEALKLALFGVGENVFEVLQISGMAQILSIHGRREAALAAVGA